MTDVDTVDRVEMVIDEYSKRLIPSASVMQELLEYDPISGDLTWKPRPLKYSASESAMRRWNTRLSGKPAMNTIANSGYKIGRVFNQKFQAHRCAWAVHFGYWPKNMLDHKNGDRADNRLENLREATPFKNVTNLRLAKNNKSGFTGVSQMKTGDWKARIQKGGNGYHLGRFPTLEEALQARKAAEVQFGFLSAENAPALTKGGEATAHE